MGGRRREGGGEGGSRSKPGNQLVLIYTLCVLCICENFLASASY